MCFMEQRRSVLIKTDRYVWGKFQWVLKVMYCISQCMIPAGVTTQSPNTIDLGEVDEAADIRQAWVLSGSEVFHDCQVVEDDYALDLDDVPLGARVALRVTSAGELHFALNGVDLGCAMRNIPLGLWLCCCCCQLSCRSVMSYVYLVYMYVYNRSVWHRGHLWQLLKGEW